MHHLQAVYNVFVFLFMHSVSECYACVVALALSEFEFGEGDSQVELIKGVLVRSVWRMSFLNLRI